MRKDLGKQSGIFPMPVILLAAYDENKDVGVMAVSWCGMLSQEQVVLNLVNSWNTVKNIMHSKAFTVNLVSEEYLKQADFLGLVSGNKIPNKFEKSGFHAIESEYVNAPIIKELPVALECELENIRDEDGLKRVVGTIVNISVDESVYDEDGLVEPLKFKSVVYDPFRNDYYSVGEKLGDAWKLGADVLQN